MEKQNILIRVVFERDGDCILAYAPGLEGCTTWGHTPKEAEENMAEVIDMYMESLIEHGESIPLGPDVTTQEVKAEVSGGPESFWDRSMIEPLDVLEKRKETWATVAAR